MTDFTKSAEDRIEDALAVAKNFKPEGDMYEDGITPETVVDQMVRALLGCPATYLGHYITNDAYNRWSAE
jgi:hypothetical protein